MHKVNTQQRSGELFVKNVVIFYFYMVIIKKCKVKKITYEISRKIGINLGKLSAANFRTPNPS